MTTLAMFTLAISLFLAVLLGGSFFNTTTFSSMALQVSEFGIITTAMCLCFFIGTTDLSIVANANMAGVISAKVMTGALFPVQGLPDISIVLIGVAVALLVAILGGLLNGYLIAKISVPPIIATIVTSILYLGVTMAISSGQIVTGLPDIFSRLSSLQVVKIPVLFAIMILVMTLVSFMMRKTALGAEMFLQGSNHVVARFSGIDTERILLRTYALVGLLAGIAALMMMSRANSAKAGYGETYVQQAILVAVLAGFHPGGGKGRILGLAFSLICVQSLQTAFNIWQLSPYTNKLIWGAALLAVMIANEAFQLRERRKFEKLTCENLKV